jgi:hypothetical protein
MVMTKLEAVTLMRGSASYEQWTHNATRVKLSNGGALPEWWNEAILGAVLDEFSSRMFRQAVRV